MPLRFRVQVFFSAANCRLPAPVSVCEGFRRPDGFLPLALAPAFLLEAMKRWERSPLTWNVPRIARERYAPRWRRAWSLYRPIDHDQRRSVEFSTPGPPNCVCASSWLPYRLPSGSLVSQTFDPTLPWHRVKDKVSTERGKILLRGANGVEQAQRLEAEGVTVNAIHIDLERFGLVFRKKAS